MIIDDKQGSKAKRLLLATVASGALAMGVAGSALGASLPVATNTGNWANATSNIAGATETVTVTTSRAYAEWSSFNIAAGQTFAVSGQTNPNWILVNKVTGGPGSTISGNVVANGQVWIIDPNGVTVNAGAVLNVGGLLLSSAAWSASDRTNFLSGATSWGFTGQASPIVMNGTVVASGGGVVALLGPSVTVGGTVTTGSNTQFLAVAAQDVTLNFTDNGTYFTLSGVSIGRGANGGGVTVSNGASISADRIVVAAAGATSAASIVVGGGLTANAARADGTDIVLMAADGTGSNASPTAQAILTTGAVAPIATGSVQSAISLQSTGSLTATGVDLLAGGNIGLAGDIPATTAMLKSAEAAINQTGGVIQATTLTGSSSGATGLTGANQVGTLSSFTTGSNFSLTNAQSLSATGVTSTGGNLTLTTTTGDLTLTGAVSASVGGTLTLNANGSLNIDSNLSIPGGGAVVLDYGAGGGDLTFVNGSNLTFTNEAAGPSLTVNGTAYTLVFSPTELAALSGSGSAAVATNLTETLAYTAAVIPNFSATLEGLGHTISGLSIMNAATKAGLVGTLVSGGVIRDLGLVGGSVGGNQEIGALVGLNQGTLEHVFSSAVVTATGSAANEIGGLVGWNNGSIATAAATGSVTAPADALRVGGLAGYNGTTGSITLSYATGAVNGGGDVGGLVGQNDHTITNAYATGQTTGIRSGGLVGYNTSTVTDDYATGAVNGSSDAGGLVGFSQGPVSLSYATGAVTGAHNVGGLLGYDNGGGVSTSYFDTITTGQTGGVNGVTVAGATGLTTAQFMNPANFPAFTFTTTPGATGNAWVIVDTDSTLNGGNGATRPLLASEYSTSIVNAHQLQLAAMNLAGSYVLTANVDASGTAVAADVWGGTAAGGFAPIGAESAGATMFTGSLNGQGYAVSGLSINRASQNRVGLFGSVGPGGSVSNLTLTGATIVGGQYTAVLVGTNRGTLSTDVVTGGTVSDTLTAGGLAGSSVGAISSSSSSAAVSGGGYVGGLVGSSVFGGSVVASSASGAVTATGPYSGGLIGYNIGAVTNDTASNTVVGTTYVGGLIGLSSGGATISGSSTTTGSSVQGSQRVGGLVGELDSGSVTGSNAVGTVNASGLYSGGLVGLNAGTLSTDTAVGAVTGTNATGGLVGYNQGLISTSSATGKVSGHDQVGGLVGINNATGSITMITADATAQVVGGADQVGGLVGENLGTVGAIGSGVAVNAAVTGSALYTGGLIGYNTGSVTGASAAGTVQGQNFTGGLIGASQSGALSGDSASASVNGAAYVGGLIGDMISGRMTVSQASGNVVATGDFVGGAVGYNAGALTGPTATGNVSGADFVGGVVGYDQGNTQVSSASGTVTSSGAHKGAKYGYSTGGAN
jgi:filamentous hemagglutinin family protein